MAAKVPLPSYVRAKYALVIGIGKFKDPEIPHLQFAAKDARSGDSARGSYLRSLRSGERHLANR